MLVQYGVGNRVEFTLDPERTLGAQLIDDGVLSYLGIESLDGVVAYLDGNQLAWNAPLPEQHHIDTISVERLEHGKGFLPFVAAIASAIGSAGAAVGGAAAAVTGSTVVGSIAGAATTGAMYGGLAGGGVAAMQGEDIGEGILEGAGSGALIHGAGTAAGLMGSGAVSSAASAAGAGPSTAAGLGEGLTRAAGGMLGAKASGMDSTQAVMTGGLYGAAYGMNAYQNAGLAPHVAPKTVGETVQGAFSGSGAAGQALTGLAASSMMAPQPLVMPTSRQGTNAEGPISDTTRREDGQFMSGKSSPTPSVWESGSTINKKFTPGLSAGYPNQGMAASASVQKTRRSFAERSLGAIV